ncbi:MAG: molybdopterin-dependent oxidoreductase [Caldilineales bacterium]|nr:molybdopterin-dependent oxidoreductase [Caldilineales bacterium]MDW8319144.1 molybdopterin-dependent oxidoreductase [Anaerolineae bacterium]
MNEKHILPDGASVAPEHSACPHEISRRDFLKASAVIGGSAFLVSHLPQAATAIRQVMAAAEDAGFFEARPENQLYSVCLQCNTGCGIKVKLANGMAAKIDGNPYSPWNLWPHIPYTTPIKDAATLEGALCPKGQAGLQTAYDPYRITAVLKRKPGTKRGEGQWITIPFDQAITEIVEGGDLFGEGHVEGFRDLYALRDPNVAKAMADAVKKILDEKDQEKKKALVEEFKATFKDHLDTLIDPDHPDLGPKNNQFAFVWGRMKNGRGDLVRRFVLDGFGSQNANGHTTVCQGSLYFSGKAMSEQWDGAKFTGGDKFYWQADSANSEFVIYVGANMFEANYGPPQRVPKMTEKAVDGSMKYAVLDPRLSKAAAKAWRWLPVKPGTDAAVAFGMIRWILDNERYNAKFLANVNKAAATANGEKTWTTGAWLVKLKDGKPGKFLRGSEVGLVTQAKETDAEGKEVTVYVTPDGVKFPFDPFVALVNGQPVAFHPSDPEAAPVMGDLFVDTTVGDHHVKTGLQLIAEEARSRTIAEWAEIADVRERQIIELAVEFTSHGTKAVVDLHRGASQHTNGFYTIQAWYVLNCLIGNVDHVGGMVKLTTYDRNGGKKGQPFPISKMTNGKNVPFGVDLLRTNTAYEKSTLFAGYPSKRPWFPLATDLYQEDVPSMGDAYPYPIKIAMFYMSAINYALPAGHTASEILADPKKIPLIITSDILVGETSVYADYIFPDVSFLERWELHGSHPSVVWKVENVRQPVMAIPGWPTVKVFGEEIPLSMEALLLAIAERLQLPGFGPNGFGEGIPYTRPEHLYLKQVANIAFGEKEDGSDAVPEADDEEMRIFLAARQHLPKAFFDPEVWKAAVGGDESLWRRVVYVLNRGGRYQDFAKAYKGDLVTNAYGKQLNLYQEKTATSINTMTGKPFVGYAKYFPPGLSSTDEEITDDGYDLTLITYKDITMTKARTITNYWLLAVLPEGFVLMSRADADRLGLKDGDRVKLLSASNPEGVWNLPGVGEVPMTGRLKVVEGMRPGVVAFPLGYGHWASGARDIVVDGQVVKGDPRRAVPLHGNAAMRVDPVLKNVTLQDIAGGSAVFYDTKVKVVKA